MNDLIERLRKAEDFYGITRPLLTEAADEIERLTKENEELKVNQESAGPDKYLSELHGLPVYLAPTAAINAALADFKRRVLEVIRPSQTLIVAKELQPMQDQGDGVREILFDIIAALPLIEEK